MVSATTVVLVAAAALQAPAHADEDHVVNPFHDPFLQLTDHLAGCPAPQPPSYSRQELRELGHERAQRGVSCWLDGRCRLHNSYLYDSEIIPRVATALHATGRFDDTSVWALGQRRIVVLQGCVRTQAQSLDLEAVVKRIDDVEGVRNELTIGTQGPPRYPVRSP